jgi:hypothetical protein
MPLPSCARWRLRDSYPWEPTFALWCIAPSRAAFETWKTAVLANPDYLLVTQSRDICDLDYGHVTILGWPDDPLGQELRAAVQTLPDTRYHYATP